MKDFDEVNAEFNDLDLNLKQKQQLLKDARVHQALCEPRVQEALKAMADDPANASAYLHDQSPIRGILLIVYMYWIAGGDNLSDLAVVAAAIPRRQLLCGATDAPRMQQNATAQYTREVQKLMPV